MHSEGEMPSLPSDSHSAKPAAPPRKSSQPDVCASPQEKPLRTLAHQAEEETEDGGLFIPMGRLSFLLIKKPPALLKYNRPAIDCTYLK